jgi:hypothetical protein
MRTLACEVDPEERVGAEKLTISQYIRRALDTEAQLGICGLAFEFLHSELDPLKPGVQCRADS